MKRRTEQLTRGLRPLAAIASLACAAGGAVAGDWPFIRGDERATGTVADKLAPPLTTLWTFQAANGAGFEATAAIVAGVVYVGDVEGTFHAIDLGSGKELWSKTFEDTGFIAGSAIVGDSIYTTDYNGVVHCLDRKDGAEKWQYSTDSSLYAAPNVYDSTVLLATDAGDLIGLNLADGKEKWKFTIDQPLRCWPAVIDGRAIVAGCDSKMHAVDATTGKEVESVDIGDAADAIPAIMGDKAYFCTAGGLFQAMTLKPLAQVWKYKQRGQGKDIHAAAACEGAIVLATHDKRVVALDPATGEELWESRLRGGAQSSPVIVGKLVFVASIRGRLSALNLATGKETWHEDVGGRFLASPAVSSGRIVIGNEDGALYCLGNKEEENARE